MNDGVFMIQNPEGEIHTIDTGDASSPFFGPEWRNVFEMRERGEFLRGRAAVRRISRDDRFSGYTLFIDGCEELKAFLPASKAAYFRDPLCDASGKCIAFYIENIYTNGTRAGSLIANAYSPLNYVNKRQRRSNYEVGSEVYALSMDYEDDLLIFPGADKTALCARLSDAAEVAARSGISTDPNDLTGCFWKVRVVWSGDGCRMVVPLEVMM